jgi:hypothetical protein
MISFDARGGSCKFAVTSVRSVAFGRQTCRPFFSLTSRAKTVVDPNGESDALRHLKLQICSLRQTACCRDLQHELAAAALLDLRF